MMQSEPSSDLARPLLFTLVIGVLLLASAWTMLPFLNGLIWATTLAIATWPALLRVQAFVGGRRGLAVAIMTIAILVVFMVPLALAVGAVLNAADRSPAVMHDFL